MPEKPDAVRRPDPSPPAEKWPDAAQPLAEVEAATKRLGEKIADARRRHDTPVDSTLGDPNWDERARDWRYDCRDEED